MKPNGFLVGSLLLAIASPVRSEIGWYEGLMVSALVVAAYPVATGTTVLLGSTAVVADLSDRDQRVLMDARDGALQAVATGRLDDVHLQAALKLLRRRYSVDNLDDRQLAQWIAVQPTDYAE